MDTTKLIGAVAQTSTVLLDTPATVQRALDLMRDAAASGAQPARQAYIEAPTL